ncbi:MAG: hypothetical protein QOE11_3041, partial [Solirubrobacteraceae bacterium]|nr:hypothetical protein [Solirubrobacteraceae bacterium]
MRLAPLLVVTIALLLAAAPAGAQSALGEYQHCGPSGEASVVDVSGATCPEAQAVAAAIVAAPPEGGADVLRAAGWVPLRALAATGGDEYDIVATRGRAALRIRRAGIAPDLDGWEGGRELLFARQTLVPGARIPRGAVLCTSAFLVRLPGGSLGGLSASHCGGTRSNGTVQRRNAALRRPPQVGVVLGRVVRNLERNHPLDALVLPVPSAPNRPFASVIDRGVSRPPWSVGGTARPLSGRRVCFSGRTSGVDQCGRMLGSAARGAERALSRQSGIVVRCTNIR